MMKIASLVVLLLLVTACATNVSEQPPSTAPMPVPGEDPEEMVVNSMPVPGEQTDEMIVSTDV